MIKLMLLSFLLMVCASTELQAQTSSKDSITNLAKADVKKLFKLKNPELSNFRKYKYTSYSDYFKPSEVNVSNPALLKDSTYVDAYRVNAYYRTKSRHTVGHYILIGG